MLLLVVVESDVLLDSNGLKAVIQHCGQDEELVILHVVVDEESKHISSMGIPNRLVL